MTKQAIRDKRRRQRFNERARLYNVKTTKTKHEWSQHITYVQAQGRAKVDTGRGGLADTLQAIARLYGAAGHKQVLQ